MQISQIPKYEIGKILRFDGLYFIVVDRHQMGSGEWMYTVAELTPIQRFWTEEQVGGGA